MVGDRHVDLPEEVVYEILVRLPVTSIGRFKCVCKHWYDVFESPKFMEEHYAVQDNSTLVLKDYLGAAGKKLRVIVEENSDEMKEVWSTYVTPPCRGLFLLCHAGQLGLLNPATKAFRLLPRMPNSCFYTPTIGTDYGLGWDPITDDYKVVYYRTHQFAAVYSLSTDSWRLLDTPPFPIWTCPYYLCLNNNSRLSINTNGFCYWITFDVNPKNSSLFCFDVAQEKLMMITLPPSVVNNNNHSLATYHDSLALLVWNRSGTIEVWVLRQEQQQHFWTKIINFGQTDPTIYAIEIWKNTHLLLRKYGGREDSMQLFMYDMNNDQYEEKVTSDNPFCFLNYKKSLFSIKGGSKDGITSQSQSNWLSGRKTYTINIFPVI